jgi:hypothetical protein
MLNRWEIKKEIIEFGNFPNNWDGYNAIPPDLKIINNALSVINDLNNVLIPEDAHIEITGNITLNWESDIGFAMLEIGRSDYSFIIIFKNRIAHVFLSGEILNLDINIIKELLKEKLNI